MRAMLRVRRGFIHLWFLGKGYLVVKRVRRKGFKDFDTLVEFQFDKWVETFDYFCPRLSKGVSGPS